MDPHHPILTLNFSYLALGRRARRGAELLEADRGIEVVAQDRLAGFQVAAQHRVDAFAQQRFGELPVGFDLRRSDCSFRQEAGGTA
jgi:hypothetical protein